MKKEQTYHLLSAASYVLAIIGSIYIIFFLNDWQFGVLMFVLISLDTRIRNLEETRKRQLELVINTNSSISRKVMDGWKSRSEVEGAESD